MDTTKGDKIVFTAGAITGFVPICGIVWSIPSTLDVVWLVPILKVGVTAIATGLSGMLTVFFTDIYTIKVKPKIFKDGKGKGQKAA